MHPSHRRRATIRDWLEADAHDRYPRLSHRLARRLPPPPRPPIAWGDRVLLALAVVFLALLLLRTGHAQVTDSWGIVPVTAGGTTAPVLAFDTDIDVAVSGEVARVEVTQRFRNDGVAWLEGRYRFPLPDGAAVDRMEIVVGQRVITGEIRERDQAQQVYAHAAAAGQTTALVEQERVNQFSTRLANIGPGEDIEVRIGYLVPVPYANGRYELRLPLTFTPRYDPPRPLPILAAAFATAAVPALTPATMRDDHGLRLAVTLPAGVGLAAIESRYHDVRIEPVPDGYRITLAGEDRRPDRDFALTWTPELDGRPDASLVTWQGTDAVYAQLLIAPPSDEAVTPRPREVVFVVDTSGSMSGTSLQQARAALAEGLARLDPDDRFNVIRFSSDHERLFARSRPADDAAIGDAARFLSRLRANGGTNMAPALAAALDLPPSDGLMRQVVFITDGAVGNEADLVRLVGERLGDARLFTVAIGSAPNDWLMRKTAEIGRGTHTHIGSGHEVRERMSALWRQIRLPAVTDLCLDWDVPAEYYPEIVPDLYAGRPLWITARLPVVPRSVTLCGELDGTDWELAVQRSDFAAPEHLRQLWARRKLEALEDRLMFGADPEDMRAEAIAVALDHGLLTRHTALVAVDRTPTRPQHAVLENEQVPSLLPAGSGATISGFAATATGWPARAGLAALLALAAGLLAWLARR